MKEGGQVKVKYKNYWKHGFFLDQNTFLVADNASILMAARKGDDGKVVDQPMIVLENVAELLLDHSGKIVAVKNKSKLGIWESAFETALERFNNVKLLD